ncbi:Ig-like domain-containing protein, partial [Reichenbachiella sp. MALMAid0571]|uniref:Ig-like domain-containing protein n=1 Tax=Reichenbachiella sp. MALMAid0571 TaxID=3143939 RepID=UPI0032DE33C7
AETVTISGALDAVAITDDAEITFTVGSADPTNGNTTIAATSPVVADGASTSTVTVQLADAQGNLLTASGGTVTLSSTGSAVVSGVTDNNDGTYTATVTNVVAETVTISGALDAVAITDDAEITFTVGSADPTNGNTTIAATSPVVAD